MFQKYAEKFNYNHNLHLIKLYFWYMKRERISNYFRKFEQNMLKNHDSAVAKATVSWPLRDKFQFHLILSFILKLSTTFNLNVRIPIFGVKRQYSYFLLLMTSFLNLTFPVTSSHVFRTCIPSLKLNLMLNSSTR